MIEVRIQKNEAGQRFDKYLKKYLPLAPSSFFYKMLRKKNITLNKKKSDGSDIVKENDLVCLFLADDTISKFRGSLPDLEEYVGAFRSLKGIEVLYEDEQALLLNKPAGVLSQKADAKDLSLNEWMIGYLLKNRCITQMELATFKPSVINRLDRNTSGIVICAKTLAAMQLLAELLRNRGIHKYYRLFIKGKLESELLLEGYLTKDTASNLVTVTGEEIEHSSLIKTYCRPIQYYRDRTLAEVELITGKSHQIRAHLAFAGYPLLGDPKYGNREWNQKYQKTYGVAYQLLHAYRLEFPILETPFTQLSQKKIICPVPPLFDRVERAE